MARVHLGVLGLLAGVAVLAFLLAPSSGRFERDALMILCGVLAIILHLALTGTLLGTPTTAAAGPVDTAARGADSAAPASEPAPEPAPDPAEIAHRTGYFDLPGASPASTEIEINLRADIADESPATFQPSVAQLWPPAGLEIPRVFTEAGEPGISARVTPLEQTIDLRTGIVAAAPADRPAPEPEPNAIEVADLAQHERVDDPWLAFAASMFRDPPN